MVDHIFMHLDSHKLERRVHRADEGQELLYLLADFEIDDMTRLSPDIFRGKADLVKQLNQIVAELFIRDGKLKMIVFLGRAYCSAGDENAAQKRAEAAIFGEVRPVDAQRNVAFAVAEKFEDSFSVRFVGNRNRVFDTPDETDGVISKSSFITSQ